MVRNSHHAGNDHGLINVAVARFSAIGDVAMTVPVVYSVCRNYPDIRFFFVTRQSMTGIFVKPPSNLTIVGVDLKHDYKGPAGMWRLVAELCRDHHIDMFVDLHNVLRTKIMRLAFALRGIRSSHIIKDRRSRRALTRSRSKRMVPLTSQRARYRQAFFDAGLPVNPAFDGVFDGHAKADPAIFAKITPPKTEGQRWVGVAPFAAHQGKIYPAELMLQALEIIKYKRPGVRFFFFGGGGDEKAILDGWAERFDGAVSLAGRRLGFAVELALINHLNAMLTMDSANMHLAAIASTPTISIWGATHPYCGFKGWRQADSDLIQLPMTCRPCSVFGNKPCARGDLMCLYGIKPADVANKIIEKLS